MSLDSIIKLTISKNNVQVAQAGFGVPLIVSAHTLWPERVRSYSSPDTMLAEGFTEDSSAVHMAKILCKQQPGVKNFKVGRRESSDIRQDLAAIFEADSDFYGVLLDSLSSEDIFNAAEWVESKRLIFGTDVHDIHDELAKKLEGLGRTRTFLIYHPDPRAHAAAALMGRMLPEEPGSSSWAFKNLAGVEPCALSVSQAAKLDKNNINRYIRIKDNGLTLQGKVCSGEYLDVIAGIDWLHARMQERLFGLLMKNKKIPYTDKGVDLVRCEIMAQLAAAVHAGILAAEPAPTVSVPQLAEVDESDKKARQLPNVHFSGTLSGAIHSLTINGTVTL